MNKQFFLMLPPKAVGHLLLLWVILNTHVGLRFSAAVALLKINAYLFLLVGCELQINLSFACPV
ncbi:MAG: hypothetical protein ACI936_003946 [Paraglaciecola sp.]|jgi:hypothetical protein